MQLSYNINMEILGDIRLIDQNQLLEPKLSHKSSEVLDRILHIIREIFYSLVMFFELADIRMTAWRFKERDVQIIGYSINIPNAEARELFDDTMRYQINELVRSALPQTAPSAIVMTGVLDGQCHGATVFALGEYARHHDIKKVAKSLEHGVPRKACEIQAIYEATEPENPSASFQFVGMEVEQRLCSGRYDQLVVPQDDGLYSFGFPSDKTTSHCVGFIIEGEICYFINVEFGIIQAPKERLACIIEKEIAFHDKRQHSSTGWMIHKVREASPSHQPNTSHAS